MTIYEYKALDKTGKMKTGIVDASDPKEAREKLRGSALSVIDLNQVDKKHAGAKKSKAKKVKLEDLALTTRQLATLLESDIPLRDAITALIDQSEDRNLQLIFRDVRERITTGVTFPDALKDHPNAFNNIYVNMARAGEASGKLDVVLHRLADYLQAQNRMQGKVSAALMYPMIMLVIGVMVVLFLMTFVIPKIQQMLTSRPGGGELPLPTQILVVTSDFCVNWWPFLIFSVFAGVIGLRIFVGTPKGRRVLDKTLVSLPIFGNLFKKQAVARFAVTFSTLLQSGLPALEALRIVKNVVNNVLMVETLEEVEKTIIEGGEMAGPIRKSKVFPPAVGYMVSMGEKSGKLESMLTKLAVAYDEEVELQIQKVTALLEPIMIVSMSGVVGFIVMAIVLPIMEMNQIN